MRSGVRVIEYGVVVQRYGEPSMSTSVSTLLPVATSASAWGGEKACHAGRPATYAFTLAGGSGSFGAVGSLFEHAERTRSVIGIRV
jgi:hypothetical protein